MVNLVWNEEDAKKFYIAQGREEGLQKGRQEGRQEGKMETLLENIRNLMETLHLSAESAMDALGISPEKQKEFEPLI
ncbi:MAG: hypothetical protein IJL14_05260 [Selenomonadaceae bacterium]|nr:hypothetical protein [Selenomonadaceae bacterium]